MFVIYIFCSQASWFRVMPHGVKSPGSIAKRKAAREGKQRTGFVEPVVELAKVPSEIVVELARFQVRWWNLQRFHVNVRRNL